MVVELIGLLRVIPGCKNEREKSRSYLYHYSNLDGGVHLSLAVQELQLQPISEPTYPFCFLFSSQDLDSRRFPLLPSWRRCHIFNPAFRSRIDISFRLRISPIVFLFTKPRQMEYLKKKSSILEHESITSSDTKVNSFQCWISFKNDGIDEEDFHFRCASVESNFSCNQSSQDESLRFGFFFHFGK